MAAHQAPPSLGFSRQEHWSGLLFPSPTHESEQWKWSRSVVSDSLRPHGMPHQTALSFTISQSLLKFMSMESVSYLTISPSAAFFSFCLQSFPASGSFLMSRLFTSGGQSIGVSASASVLPRNSQDWFPLELTGLISLWSKGLSRVFSNTTVQKHQFFSA